MHLKHWIKLYLLFGIHCVVHGQQIINGKIIDDAETPLGFATIYAQGTTNGTTANAQGLYQLRLPAGDYNLVAQYIGYSRLIKSITVGASDLSVDFQLQPEALMLKEVIIGAKNRDPAKRVIRNAIKKRKYYRDEALAFACDVYVKGLQRIDKKPRNLLTKSIPIDTGIIYFSESISELKFMQPDKFTERMISSKVSGRNNAFSYNMASDMMINLYDNSFFVDGLCQRPLISPISNNALLYYNYKLVGTFLEGDLLINKIQLLPKHPTDPVFSGYLYIIEDTWRIHSVDVSLTDKNGIAFVDSLSFKQVFAPVGYDIWMPISQRFAFEFKVFGFEGNGHFTGIYSNYEVEPAYWQAPIPAEESNTEATPDQKTVSVPRPKVSFSKKDFSDALMVVEEESNVKDSIYWAQVRPIPLTSIELLDYKIKDSIAVIRETKQYKDSLDTERNQFKLTNLLLTGYTYRNSTKGTYITFPTLLNGLLYNSVEGAVANLEFEYLKRNKTSTAYIISPSLRYGFQNKTPQAKISAIKSLNLKKRERIYGGFGRYIYQINDQEPINTFANSYFTLVWGENYAKLFQKTFAELGYQKEVLNGFLLSGEVSYAHRESLENSASYNFRDKVFTPNSPNNTELNSTSFNEHQAMIFSVKARLRFNQKYIDRPNRKIILETKYPEITLSYKKGINGLGSDIDFDILRIGTNYEVRLGQVGELQLSGVYSTFLSNEKIHFPDFQHFNGNQVYITTPGVENGFQLLNYYQFSTKQNALQGHLEQHFNEFIFNKIPFVRHLNLQAVGSLNYLHTPALGQYLEVGFGVEHIFKIMRIDYFTSFRNGNRDASGLRFGIGI